MVTCFVLAGQIVLNLSSPFVVIDKDGTETEDAFVETIIFPKGKGVHITQTDGLRFEFFEGGQKQHNPTTIDPFMIPYEEVVAALSDCRTDQTDWPW